MVDLQVMDSRSDREKRLPLSQEKAIRGDDVEDDDD
jgi:hypothetical protein